MSISYDPLPFSRVATASSDDLNPAATQTSSAGAWSPDLRRSIDRRSGILLDSPENFGQNIVGVGDPRRSGVRLRCKMPLQKQRFLYQSMPLVEVDCTFILGHHRQANFFAP